MDNTARARADHEAASPCAADGAAPHVLPTTICDSYGLLVIDAAGAWVFRLAPQAPHTVAADVLTRDYAVVLSDGSIATINVAVSLLSAAPRAR